MTPHFDRERPDRTRPSRPTARGRSPLPPEHGTDAASLQRTLGNRAAAQLLGSRGATGDPAPRSPVLQRNGKSKEVMEYLATPRTFELKGEDIQVQDLLALELDKAIARHVIKGPREVEKLNKEWFATSQELATLQKRAKQLDQEPSAGEGLLASDRRQTKLNALQDRIDALQAAMNQQNANLMSYSDATFIGAIILKHKVGTVKELIAGAQLVDLPSVNDRQATVKQSLGGSAFQLVEKRKLAPFVISNTLVTMEKARQLEYFREAGLPNEKYVILVEVHYYRDRPVSSTKLHKDTKGETLFVNLSFTNKKKVLGPEYITNPASNAIYDQFVKRKLPEVFVDDLEAVRRGFKGKRMIEATVLEADGVVAFVDEAVHHKTPTAGPRTASADGLKSALAYVYQGEYADAENAYKSYAAAPKASRGTAAAPGGTPPPRTSSFFTDPTARAHATDWLALHENLATLAASGKQLNRAQLRQWLPHDRHFMDHADEILEQAATDFTSVSFSHLGQGTLVVPVRQRGEEPLERRMSMTDLSQYKATAAEGGKRSFFRTWVRAVPRAQFG
jgi:hypothetical protein